MGKGLYFYFLLMLSTFMLYSGDGITDGIRAEQEAEEKRVAAEKRAQAAQRIIQIASEQKQVDSDRRALHKEEQRTRTRGYDDWGDEPYSEKVAIQTERAQQHYQAVRAGLKEALMATGLFYTGKEGEKNHQGWSVGTGKGGAWPAGLNFGSEYTSVRAESPVRTKLEYDQRCQDLKNGPRGVVQRSDKPILQGVSHVLIVDDLVCVDPICVEFNQCKHGYRLQKNHWREIACDYKQACVQVSQGEPVGSRKAGCKASRNDELILHAGEQGYIA